MNVEKLEEIKTCLNNVEVNNGLGFGLNSGNYLSYAYELLDELIDKIEESESND